MRIVVVLGICSSTRVLEKLHAQGELGRLADFLAAVMKFLRARARRDGFEVYKFVGDAWILLFPGKASAASVLGLAAGFCHFVRQQSLSVEVTIGMASGKLVRLPVRGDHEYIGRAINLAVRLQGASLAYQALLSSELRKRFLPYLEEHFQWTDVKRDLKGIRGGAGYPCASVKLV